MLVASLRKALYALRGDERYKRFEELQKLQYLSHDELVSRQFEELSKLIQHAYDTTIYYKKLFDSLGIKPKDIHSFEDYAKLPILTKKIMQENLEELCSSATPKQERILNSSGGTTGNPASFYQDKKVFSEMEAHFLLILSFAGWTADDMIFSLWGNAKDFLKPKKLGRIKPWLAGFQQLNAFRYSNDNMKDWVKAIKRHKKVFLYGYACALNDFAAYCAENNIIFNNIGGVISTAEQLLPHYKKTIEKSFNCKVYDQYGAREVQSIACECENSNMHILTTSAYTEFLPLEENAIHEYDTLAQRLILTSLTNYTMPLLRYEIGDFASPITTKEKCKCNREHELMQMNVGRIGGTLFAPTGEKMYSSLFVRQVCAIAGIANFQFRQKSLREIELYIVKNKDFTNKSEQDFASFQKDFSTDICPGANLTIYYVDDIPRTQGGKHRQVVCEIEDLSEVKN